MMIKTALILLVAGLLSACGVIGTVERYVGLAADLYCSQSERARAITRLSVARTIAPHKVEMHCAAE